MKIASHFQIPLSTFPLYYGISKLNVNSVIKRTEMKNISKKAPSQLGTMAVNIFRLA